MTGPDTPRGTSLFSQLLLVVGVGLALLVLGETLARWFGSAEVLGPTFTEHDPLYGKHLKPNFTARRTTPESSFVLRTNSLGFRDPEPAGPLEGAILFLGDSNTLGYGVENDEAFPALVRARLAEAGAARVPVVNAGLPNSGNAWWLPFLERRASGLSPRVVVLQISPDDFADNPSDRLFSLEKGALQPRSVPPPSWRQRIWAAIDALPGLGYSHLVAAFRFRSGPRDPAEPPDGEALAGYPLTRALLAEAVDRARSNGWPTLALLVGLEGERRDAAVQVLDAWGVPWLRVPSAEEAPELYFADGHLNVEGHRVAAERVWGALGVVLEGETAPGSGRTP